MLPQSLQKSMLEASARTAAGVQESVAAIETIRIFSAEEEEEKQHSWNLAKELRLQERIQLELAFFTLVHRVRGDWEWEHQGMGMPGSRMRTLRMRILGMGTLGPGMGAKHLR